MHHAEYVPARTRIKQSILKGSYYAALPFAYRQLFGTPSAVLMLHRVRPDQFKDATSNRLLEISPEFLEEFIRYTLEDGFQFKSLDELATHLSLKETSPTKTLYITLDDGYLDNYEFAYPIFRKYDIPFCIFVPSAFPSGDGFLWWDMLSLILSKNEYVTLEGLEGFEGEHTLNTTLLKTQLFERLMKTLFEMPEDFSRQWTLDLCEKYSVNPRAYCQKNIMSWDHLREISRDRLCSIGAHTVYHYAVKGLDKNRARDEIDHGRQVLEEELGVKVNHFAFPYGHDFACGERDSKIVRDLGFQSAYTTRTATLKNKTSQDRFELPRLSLNGYFQDIRYYAALLSGAIV